MILGCLLSLLNRISLCDYTVMSLSVRLLTGIWIVSARGITNCAGMSGLTSSGGHAWAPLRDTHLEWDRWAVGCACLGELGSCVQSSRQLPDARHMGARPALPPRVLKEPTGGEGLAPVLLYTDNPLYHASLRDPLCGRLLPPTVLSKCRFLSIT